VGRGFFSIWAGGRAGDFFLFKPPHPPPPGLGPPGLPFSQGGGNFPGGGAVSPPAGEVRPIFFFFFQNPSDPGKRDPGGPRGAEGFLVGGAEGGGGAKAGGVWGGGGGGAPGGWA